MNKVVKHEFVNDIIGVEEHHSFKLDNGDQILILEKDYDRIMLHKSVNGKTYKAVVIEHEDFETPIEYIGFELV